MSGPTKKAWVLAVKCVRAVRFDVPLPGAGVSLLDQGDLFGSEVNGILVVPSIPFEQTVVPGAHPIVREGLLDGDMADPDLVSRQQIRGPNTPPGRTIQAQPGGSDRRL